MLAVITQNGIKFRSEALLYVAFVGHGCEDVLQLGKFRTASRVPTQMESKSCSIAADNGNTMLGSSAAL